MVRFTESWPELASVSARRTGAPGLYGMRDVLGL